MPDKNNQLGWEDLEDFGKSFFQGHSDFMNKATTDFYVDPPKEEKPLTPYGQSLVDNLSEFDKLNPYDPTDLGLTPAKDGDTNSNWDTYNAGVDSMVDLSFDENIVSSVPFDNGITNTLDPRYEEPVKGTTFDGQEFTYQDTTDTYKSGLVIQNATSKVGSDDDSEMIDAMNYRGDDEKILSLQKSIVSRKENGDGTVTYKFNNSPGSHMQEKLSDEAVQEQSSIASSVAALEAQILSIENGTSFAAHGEKEQLKAKLAEEKAKLIVADEVVLKEEENLIKQETDIKLIKDGDTTDAEFAAAPPADPTVLTNQSDEDVSANNEEKDKLTKKIAAIDSSIDKHMLRNQVEKVDKLFTSESKYDWVNSIRAFYKENPEIATAIIKAASNYLQTGKWYTAAAAGLEGALLGAGTKITMDNKDAADRATLRNQGYTGASVNKFMVTKNPEDLEYDFTKKQHEYAQWLKKKQIETGIVQTKDYNKWFLELNEKNTLWMEGRTKIFVDNAKGIYDEMGEDAKSFAKNNTAGIESGDVMSMILDYAHQKGPDGQYLLPRGPNGEFDLKQIPPKVFKDMQNIVENFSRQQYRNFQKNGGVMDTNFNFANYYDQYKIHTKLMGMPENLNGELFNSTMFKNYTENKDGEFMGEAMIMGTENINNQIFLGKFDATDKNGNVTQPRKEQIWKHLAIQWAALSDADKEEWNKASQAESDVPTTGFLFFSNQLITHGETHEWMASRNIKLFQDPDRKDN
jgi:hypothetical protein